eukprot:gene14044-14159_t
MADVVPLGVLLISTSKDDSANVHSALLTRSTDGAPMRMAFVNTQAMLLALVLPGQ